MSRRRGPPVCALLLCAALACGEPPPDPATVGPVESARRALALMDSALARTIGPRQVRTAGGLVVDAEGVRNAGVELQGLHPDSLSPGDFRETLAVAGDGRRVGYDYRHDRFDGTRERLREVYGPGDRRLIFVLDQGFTVHLRSPDHVEEGRRLARRLPGHLLEEVRQRPADLRWRGRDGTERLVTGTLADGRTVDLRFGAEGLLRSVAYATDAPGLGDTVVQWGYDDYRPVEDLGRLPWSYAIRVRSRPFVEMTVEDVALGADAAAAVLEPPEGQQVPEAQEIGPAGDASAGAEVREVAPGVYLAVNLRGGFHPMFVEFEDFVVAADAPAGYPMLERLPAVDVAPGPSAAWLSERYLELIREAVPDKPVRYVVLTHHHGDHAGGVRAFVAEGATVLAPPPAAEVVRADVGDRHALAPDRLARRGDGPEALRVEVVDGRRTISDGERTLEILDVGRNPHTDHMLVLRLAEEDVWFVSDLLDPAPVERYPKPEHAALDRWFAGWLGREGHRPERIYTIHGSGLVTPEHLARLRDGR